MITGTSYYMAHPVFVCEQVFGVITVVVVPLKAIISANVSPPVFLILPGKSRKIVRPLISFFFHCLPPR
jgi:hypothetical protein